MVFTKDTFFLTYTCHARIYKHSTRQDTERSTKTLEVVEVKYRAEELFSNEGKRLYQGVRNDKLQHKVMLLSSFLLQFYV